jgi:GH15 family glucan-1,4-alpha-glucosidase
MRDLPVGNGRLLVNFDDKYQIRDIYFPHVGQENHTEGYPFRFGVWVDGAFSWVSSEEWTRDLRYLPGKLITSVTLRSQRLKIEIVVNDWVHPDADVLMRRFRVRDLGAAARDVRFFMHHDFRLYENKVGDTAFYDPGNRALVHYKKHRYFLINTSPHFDQFATGRKAFRHQEGTWRDAEDGELHGSAITEGSVDSTIAVHGRVGPDTEFYFYYWIAAGTTLQDTADTNRFAAEMVPGDLMQPIGIRAIEEVHARSKEILPGPVIDLYERSLLITAAHIDSCGAIIAAADHDVIHRATDHYAYLWHRDGAFIANAMDKAGRPEFARQFLTLSAKIIHPRGYFLQKYNPDGSLGSGWHTYWDKALAKEVLPIQEDETALTIWAAWQHFELHDDRELATQIYEPLIIRACDFMVDLRHENGLPAPSWNLWEDRHGIHTFTCATVVGALRAGARFASLFNDEGRSQRYADAAEKMVKSMREHLFSPSLGRFLTALLTDGNDKLVPDTTIDASLFAIFYFGCFDIHDPAVIGTMRAVEDVLYVQDGIGGVARFENDAYMRVADDVPGNPWAICTLWLAEYYIARAATTADLGRALELLEWVNRVALPSGVLAEQFDPKSGAALSVSPLTWSHSTFVATVLSYLERSETLAATD